jgi:hypothetical protein
MEMKWENGERGNEDERRGSGSQQSSLFLPAHLQMRKGRNNFSPGRNIQTLKVANQSIRNEGLDQPKTNILVEENGKG